MHNCKCIGPSVNDTGGMTTYIIAETGCSMDKVDEIQWSGEDEDFKHSGKYMFPQVRHSKYP